MPPRDSVGAGGSPLSRVLLQVGGKDGLSRGEGVRFKGPVLCCLSQIETLRSVIFHPKVLDCGDACTVRR